MSNSSPKSNKDWRADLRVEVAYSNIPSKSVSRYNNQTGDCFQRKPTPPALNNDVKLYLAYISLLSYPYQLEEHRQLRVLSLSM